MNFKCRSCRSKNLLSILSLGRTPLANALLKEEQLSHYEETFPLELVFCPRCTLVQITETIPPEKLFRDYFYFSSFSTTVLENAKKLAEKMIFQNNLSENSLVVEIASNDGYLLKNYKHSGVPVLGIEPAINIARVADENGIPTIKEFFNENLANELRTQGKSADIIHAHNVIAHVANLHSVVEGISTLLKPDGIAIIENHYVKNLIDQVEFDSIYHEHLCYYSATSFNYLFEMHGLKMVDVEKLPIHGGSLRAYFQRADGPCSMYQKGKKHITSLFDEEKSWGVTEFGFYQNFSEKVEQLRKTLLAKIQEIKNKGKHIAVYGASAKSTTLLNYFNIGSETVDYVVDRSTAKQGFFTPGTHLPIYATEKLLETQPDFVLLLSWNFKDEILKQQREYIKRGGRFIIPIPELEIVNFELTDNK